MDHSIEGATTMRKFGSLGLKILKMFHILLIVFFLGGILLIIF